MTLTTADPVVAFDALPPISLAQLQDQAAFLTRRDRKYLVPAECLEPLLGALDPATRVLEIDGHRAFTYTTPYFDDAALTAYHLALRCRPHRFKVRTRLYAESGLRHLEVKVRDARGRTVKHRIPRDDGPLDRLTDAERAWLRGIPPVAPHAARLHHRLTSQYRRSTLVLPAGAARVTVDRELVFALPAASALSLPQVAIIETKGAGPPTPFDRVLWRHGYRPHAISKFAAGLALLLPELPANRWHRLRQRLLAEAEVHAEFAGTTPGLESAE